DAALELVARHVAMVAMDVLALAVEEEVRVGIRAVAADLPLHRELSHGRFLRRLLSTRRAIHLRSLGSCGRYSRAASARSRRERRKARRNVTELHRTVNTAEQSRSGRRSRRRGRGS